MSRPVTESRSRVHRVWIDTTVHLEASFDDVQAKLEDIRAWPTWTPGMRKLRISESEPVHHGSSFWMLLAMKPLPALWVPSVVFHLRRGHIEWGGGGLGSVIRHRFEITEVAPGRTAVRHVEYATGLLAWILRPFEKAIRAHDQRWTAAIAEHFGATH